MFCKLDVRRKLIVTLALSSKIVVRYLVIQQGPDLQNILRQTYDCLTIMPKLRSTYDVRLIYKTSYNEWKGFHI